MRSGSHRGGKPDAPGLQEGKPAPSVASSGGSPYPSSKQQVEDLELRLLIQAAADRYGYDFSNYEPAFLRARLFELLRTEGLATLTSLQEKLLHDSRTMEKIVIAMSLDPASLFEDSTGFAALRRHAMPALRDLFFVRAWQVGCATGERAYSLAILMQEAGLAEKSRIYVSDMNATALRRAKQGIFPLSTIQDRRTAYANAGGKMQLEDYYTTSFDNAVMEPALRRSMVFVQHNLVTDGSINEFHLIVSTSILNRFNTALKRRTLELYHDSLAPGGFLLLGPGETPRLGVRTSGYETLDESAGLFRKPS